MQFLKIIKYILWVSVVVSFWYFLRDYLAPDGCLDSGGSFDYVNWECSYGINHKYIEVSVFKLKSYWVAVTIFLVALSIQLITNKAKNGT